MRVILLLCSDCINDYYLFLPNAPCSVFLNFYGFLHHITCYLPLSLNLSPQLPIQTVFLAVPCSGLVPTA